jgi:hypothetical protein
MMDGEQKQEQSRVRDEHEEVKWNKVCCGNTHAQDKAMARRAAGGNRWWPVRRRSAL